VAGTSDWVFEGCRANPADSSKSPSLGGRFNLMLSLSNGGISCEKTLANAGVFIFFKYQ